MLYNIYKSLAKNKKITKLLTIFAVEILINN